MAAVTLPLLALVMWLLLRPGVEPERAEQPMPGPSAPSAGAAPVGAAARPPGASVSSWKRERPFEMEPASRAEAQRLAMDELGEMVPSEPVNVESERSDDGAAAPDSPLAGPIEAQPAQPSVGAFVSVQQAPLSSFAIDVDTASYAVVRRYLSAGRLPPRAAVHIEELINHFSYAYPEPTGDELVTLRADITDAPWAPQHRLVRVALRAIDRQSPARGVRAEPATRTPAVVAKDVKLEIELNPEKVGAYRLLGYDNRRLGAKGVQPGSTQAGELDSGRRVTAFYEVVPAAAGEALGQRSARFDGALEKAALLVASLSFQRPEGGASVVRTAMARGEPLPLQGDLAFAVAVAQFGMLLRQFPEQGTSSFEQVLLLARSAQGSGSERAVRAELVEMVKRASGLERDSLADPR
jgi:hypothetical protein